MTYRNVEKVERNDEETGSRGKPRKPEIMIDYIGYR